MCIILLSSLALNLLSFWQESRLTLLKEGRGSSCDQQEGVCRQSLLDTRSSERCVSGRLMVQRERPLAANDFFDPLCLGVKLFLLPV